MLAVLVQNLRIRTIVLVILPVIIAQLMMVAPTLALPITAILLTGAVTAFMLVPIGALFPFYLTYLLFEGAVKILSNYNPALHVGSDVILLATVWRLYQRKNGQPDIAKTDDATAADLRVATVFFALFWIWVAVQFFNPVGIGILPSVASLKLHLVPYLCFFIVCFLLSEKETLNLAYWVLGLVFFEAAFAFFDWFVGVEFLSFISPRYMATYWAFLKGGPYRPFGTCALPGQPAVWVAHGFVMLFIAVYHRGQALQTASKGAVEWWKRWWWAALYPVLGTVVLLVCQIRVVLIRAVILCLAGLAVQGKKHGTAVLIASVILGYWLVAMPAAKGTQDDVERPGISGRVDGVLSRFSTLKSADTYKKARGGTWAFDELWRRAGFTATGIGLSRVSASSLPWTDRIRENPYFGAEWGFTDNLMLAVFTELGVFGLGSYLLLLVSLALLLLKRSGPIPKLVGFYILLQLAAGYASEGLLYQPEASVFWTTVGIGFRMRQPA